MISALRHSVRTWRFPNDGHSPLDSTGGKPERGTNERPLFSILAYYIPRLSQFTYFVLPNTFLYFVLVELKEVFGIIPKANPSQTQIPSDPEPPLDPCSKAPCRAWASNLQDICWLGLFSYFALPCLALPLRCVGLPFGRVLFFLFGLAALNPSLLSVRQYFACSPHSTTRSHIPTLYTRPTDWMTWP